MTEFFIHKGKKQQHFQPKMLNEEKTKDILVLLSKT